MASKVQVYPTIPPNPVTVTVGGITYDDPYLSLEDDSEGTIAWQEAQNSLAESYLREWTGFAPLRHSILRRGTHAPIVAPRKYGKHWFQTVQPDEGRSVLKISAEPCGEGTILIDPNALSRDVPLTLDWFYPSPDGSLVAFGLSERGSEQSVLHIIETESGTILPERIPHTAWGDVVWLPESDGLYFTATEGPAAQNPNRRLYFHRPGAEVRMEPEAVPVDELTLSPQISRDGKYLSVISDKFNPRPTFIKTLPDGAWRPFLLNRPEQCMGTWVDGEYVAIDRGNHPRGRLVAIPSQTGDDESTWREIVPESDAVLWGVTQAGKKIVISELVDVVARITILSPDGKRETTVPLPASGAVGTSSAGAGVANVSLVNGSDDPPQLTFVFQSMTQSAAIYSYDIDTGKLNQLTRPLATHDHLEMQATFATSADGTRVPVFLLHQKNLDRSTPHPLVIHAYGGFNIAYMPGYYSQFIPFVEAGGIFAQVSPRGGAEYGNEWWQGGKLGNKQNTFDDVYAAAEMLVAEGLTTKDQLGFYGASNGGMLAGVLATQRPEVFKAIVSAVPILDLLRVTREPWTLAVAASDYGDPTIPEQARWLHAYSPYHRLVEGTPYPAFLAFAGKSDQRCPLWHSRKFIARMQPATSSANPVLLRYWENVGHGTGLSAADSATFQAEWVGFLMQHIGLSPAP